MERTLPPPPPPSPPQPPPPVLVRAERSPGFWWRVLSPVGGVLSAFLALIVAAGVGYAIFGEEHEDTIGTLATVLGSLLILLFGMLLLSNLPRHDRYHGLRVKHTVRGSVLMGINVGIGMVITAGVIVVLGTLIDTRLQDIIEDTDITLGPGAWGIVLTVIALVVLAPLGEELMFRVLLLRGLARRLAFWPAAVISSIVFACAHLDVWVDLFWPRGIALAVIGVGLAWLYRWRGYWAAVAAHATVNTVAAIALLIQQT